jgi:MYXO-CTERM domain-containing protein
VHTAERVIECGPGYYQFSAPWRIELPQGGVIRGGPQNIGSWPTDFATQPANRRILRQGESGPGRVLEDNGATIDEGISTYSASVPTPPTHPSMGAGGDSSGSGGARTNGSDPTTMDDFFAADPQGGGCGCRVGGRPPLTGALLALAGLAALWRRRRR